MQVINFGTNVQKMTSREIAELTGKRHDHVMVDIRKMLLELYGEGGIPNFRDTHRNEQNGQYYPIFNLPKRETMILVSGYSIPMRSRIIDRWESLETGKATPAAVPTNRASEDMVVLSALADALRLEGSARLGVMRKGIGIVAPRICCLLCQSTRQLRTESDCTGKKGLALAG